MTFCMYSTCIFNTSFCRCQ